MAQEHALCACVCAAVGRHFWCASFVGDAREYRAVLYTGAVVALLSVIVESVWLERAKEGRCNGDPWKS